MAAAGKKSKTGPNPPPIEGEIVTGERTSSAQAVGTGSPAARLLSRRFVWVFAAAAAVFIGGILAAPYVSDGIAALFGGSEPIPVSAQTTPGALVETRLPEPSAQKPEPDSRPEAVPAASGGDEADGDSTDMAGDSGNDLAGLAARVAALEEAAAGSPEGAAQIAARLAALEARLDLLELVKESAPEAPAGLRADIGERIGELEARLAAAEAKGAGADRMLLALARLSQRAQAGQAFVGEMLEFRTLIDAMPADARAGIEAHAAVLAGHAEKGVKSTVMLQRDFATALPAVLEAAVVPEDAGWWDKAWAQIKGVVVVRRTGEVEGPGIEAILARAEFHLSRDDVAAALGETDALDAVAREALAGWRDDAADTLAVRQAVGALIDFYSRPGTDTAAAEGR